MSILAYCIVASSSAAVAPETAIRNAPLLEVEEEGLRAFYSEYKASPATAREDALAFYLINRAIFREAAIIPFRFPTVLNGMAELREHVVEHATRYATALQRLADLVQMEIRVTAPDAAADAAAASGAEYLKSKKRRGDTLAHAVAAAHKAGGAMIRAWHTREMREGTRCFALIPRTDAAELVRRVGALPQGAISIAVTGPWPATEFLEE